ncbi:MAG: replicative DNA helicase [Pseudomonadota bacterium]
MATILDFETTQDARDAAGLPANIEAEAAFLGACLLDNRVLEDLPVPLTPEHFYEPLHGRIFERICQVTGNNMLANPVTLKPYFDADEAMKALGGPGYLAQLTGSGASLIGARDFARQIHDLALLRELVSVGRTLVERATDTSETLDPSAQIEEAETALYRVSGGDAELGQARTLGQAATLAVAGVQKALNSGGHLSGVTTGLATVNAKIGGLHASDLVILGGRPGMAKTSLATNIAFAAAERWMRDKEAGVPDDKNMGAKAVFFSLEMSADQLATRILAEQSGISSENLRMGRISHHDFDNLSAAAARLQSMPLYIDDTPALTIAALRTRARRLKRRHDIGLVIVDYLQLLQGSSKSGDNRVQEISEISRGLKTLAKELNVPVLALSQLSRAVESRDDKRPQLSDLRESGSIEQDADIVLFLFREEYYVLSREPKKPLADDDVKIHDDHAKWAMELERVAGLSELIVAKQRHGSTGKVRLHFESRLTKFSDLADDSYRDDDD